MNVSIFITGGITPELASQVQTVCAEIARSKVETVSVMLASRGGDVVSGLAIHNMLRLLSAKVRMVNMGQVGSIAATIYLAGDERLAMPGTNFFLHAAYFVEGENKDKISPNTQLILAPFRDRIGWDQVRLDHYFTQTKEQYFGIDEAAAMSIVSDTTIPKALARTELCVSLNPHGDATAEIASFIKQLRSRKLS